MAVEGERAVEEKQGMGAAATADKEMGKRGATEEEKVEAATGKEKGAVETKEEKGATAQNEELGEEDEISMMKDKGENGSALGKRGQEEFEEEEKEAMFLWFSRTVFFEKGTRRGIRRRGRRQRRKRKE